MKFLTTLLLAGIISDFKADAIVESEKGKKILLEEISGGKTLFLKFYAPWCVHCKKMSKAWDELTQEWQESDVGLVMEFDCTSEKDGEAEICDFFGIESFPTILYGSSLDLQPYDGGRAYEELSEFARQNLVPTCSTKNQSLCDDETKQKIEEYLSKSTLQLENMVHEVEKQLSEIEKKYLKEVEELQKRFQKLKDQRNQAVHAVRNNKMGIKMMLSAWSGKTDNDRDEL